MKRYVKISVLVPVFAFCSLVLRAQYRPAADTASASGQAALTARIAKLEQQLREVIGRRTSYVGYGPNLTDLSAAVDALEKKVKALTGTSYSFQQSSVAELSEKVEGLEKKVKTLTGTSSSFRQSSVADLSRKVDELTTRVEKLSGGSSSYGQPSVSDLSRKVERLEAKITALERRIGSLESKVR